MFLKPYLYSVLLVFVCKVTNILSSYEFNDTGYAGEKFPTKYLSKDNIKPSFSDLEIYFNGLRRIVDHFSSRINTSEPDPNVALGMYFTKCILIKILKENNVFFDTKRALQEEIKRLINGADSVVSHYRIDILREDKDSEIGKLKDKLTKLFRFEEPFVYSIRDLNNGKMVGWIHSPKNVNNFVEQMDNGTFSKQEYVRVLMNGMDEIYPVFESDMCILDAMENSDPIHLEELRPCVPNPGCMKKAIGFPSYGYVISHRLMVVLSRRMLRRCYILSSVEEENAYIDLMCSNMYRETVYIARRGFFARDMFLEHLALCAFFGYEEFFRRNWFLKAASWVDSSGCVPENYNFLVNQTSMRLAAATDPEEFNEIKEFQAIFKVHPCHSHPMSLNAATLAHGVRYALHYLGKSIN